MTAEARERYYLDINKKFPMQDPNIEGNAQAEDSSQSINLEDWTITFKEFQPKRSCNTPVLIVMLIMCLTR